jgi:hypothetical protein
LYLPAGLRLKIGTVSGVVFFCTLLNTWIDNAGDLIRAIGWFYLMLAPSGAAWSLDSLWQRWRRRRTGPVFIHPWPLRLLVLQMMVMYGCNGLYKVPGDRCAHPPPASRVLRADPSGPMPDHRLARS